jgi:hypothetical protein
MTRDNFCVATKVSLAKRVGFRCSFPGCDAVTVGPSDEGLEATASTGEAAHISAASGGQNARRYQAALTPEKRSSIENGIWCCNLHAKLIDTDETTYTIPMLKKWKVLAEHRAQLRQAYGDMALAHQQELISDGLAPNSIVLITGAEIAQQIGTAVRNSYLSEIYGRDAADAIRDFLIEYVRNAFTHGAAITAEIKFESSVISVIDDGAAFNISALSGQESRGGGQAYRVMLSKERLGCASSRHVGGKNYLHIPIVLNVDHLPRVNPCAIALSKADLRAGSLNVSRVSGCSRIFLIAPQFSVYSDGPAYVSILKRLSVDHANVVLIVPNASAGVIEHYRQLLPGVLVVAWGG